MSQVEEIALHSFFTDPHLLICKEPPEQSDQMLGLSHHLFCCQCYTVLRVFKGQKKHRECCPQGWWYKGSLHWSPALGMLWAGKINHICLSGASKLREEWWNDCCVWRTEFQGTLFENLRHYWISFLGRDMFTWSFENRCEQRVWVD